jgi:hypothetical protein
MQKMARVKTPGESAASPVAPKAKIFPKKPNFGIIKP